MLREYTSKPCTVLACEMIEEGDVKDKGKGVWRYTHKGRGASTTMLDFSVSKDQEPEAGDFIIKLSKTDIYLCKAEVFHAKYGVKGMVIR